MPGLILSTLISVIIVGIATVVIVLFLSHCIAGPLYKFENSLERIGNGDMSFDIHFRKGDEAKRLAEIFNASSRGLNNLISDVKAEFAQLRSIINELGSSIEKLPEVQQGNLKEVVKKLKCAAQHLNEKLSRFILR
jgi:methyl-accepting chemotaxis protein